MRPPKLSGAEAAAIVNLEALLDHGDRELRRLALSVAAVGLAACDPELATMRLVHLEGEELIVAGEPHVLHPGGRIVVLGSGKASMKIGIALERILGDRVSGGMIIVRDAPPEPVLKRIELLEAGHPLPDARSVSGAQRIFEQADALGPDDLLIACFTGGSSALTSLPPAGVSAAEKRELHRLLLSAGVPISEVNAVRKRVSAIKGGGLALAAAPARVLNLTVSDVAGDPLDVLTDPSVPDTSTVADALAVLHDHDLWDSVPVSIRRHLADPALAVPDLRGVDVSSILLVTGETACEAMAAAGAGLGAEPVVVSTSFEEEAAPFGRVLAGLARESAERGRPFPRSSVLVGCGGESTVRLDRGEDFGLGGPNQEAALAAASRIQGAPVAVAFLDTDGSDGGTGLAGAVADGLTIARARDADIDLGAVLRSHRAGEAARALGDGIETGPTHTNVNDLFVVAVG
jgi:hydroxypyruvate reductase/glycerate 2-kinase